MNSPARYSPEVRERAVCLVLDHQGEHDSQWSAITSVASKLGCTAQTLRKWVRQADSRFRGNDVRPRGAVQGSRATSAAGSRSWSARTESCAERTRSFARRRRICLPSADNNTAIPEPALPQSVRCEPARPSGAGRPAEPAPRLTACRGRLRGNGGRSRFRHGGSLLPKGSGVHEIGSTPPVATRPGSRSGCRGRRSRPPGPPRRRR